MSMAPPTAPAKKTNWFLIAAGGASILGLLALVMKNNSSAGGTTAAGTSINAALGSLQEEQLNTQGSISSLQASLGLPSNMTLTDVLGANTTAIEGGLSTVGTQVGNLQTSTDANAAAAASAAASNASAASAQSQDFFSKLMAALGGLSAGQANLETGQQNLAAGQANQNTELGQIQEGIAGLTSGQQQLLIGQILSDVHNQINFNAVQAGLQGQPNPALTNGSTY